MDIAKSVGSSRILRGFAITCPVGNPNMGEADEERFQDHYVDKALAMLVKEGERGRVEDV